MFNHVMVGASDLGRSKAFYDAVFKVLGIEPTPFKDTRVFYRGRGGVFAITKPLNGQAATFANGGTIGFLCESPEEVDAWHAAGIANGGTTCEDPPGPRTSPAGDAYLAYMRDPDGNKLAAIHR